MNLEPNKTFMLLAGPSQCSVVKPTENETEYSCFRPWRILLPTPVEAILSCRMVHNIWLHFTVYIVLSLFIFELHMYHFETGNITTKLWWINWGSTRLNDLPQITGLVRCKVWTCNQSPYSFSICDTAELMTSSLDPRTQEAVLRWFDDRQVFTPSLGSLVVNDLCGLEHSRDTRYILKCEYVVNAISGRLWFSLR